MFGHGFQQRPPGRLGVVVHPEGPEGVVDPAGSISKESCSISSREDNTRRGLAVDDTTKTDSNRTTRTMTADTLTLPMSRDEIIIIK